MKPFVFCFALCFSGVSAHGVAADRIIRVEPGLWEYTHSLEIPNVLAPITTPKTECITADEAQRNLSDLLSELTTGGNCAVSNLKDNLNTIKLELSCTPDVSGLDIKAGGEVEIRYGRTKITGSASGLISVGDTDMSFDAMGEATRIGRCADRVRTH